MVAQYASACDYLPQSRNGSHVSLRRLLRLVSQKIQLDAGGRARAIHLFHLRLCGAYRGWIVLPRTKLGLLLVSIAMAGVLVPMMYFAMKHVATVSLRRLLRGEPEGDEREGHGRACPRPRGARARLRTSDYKQHDSWHEPIGRSRERASRGSLVHRLRSKGSPLREDLSDECGLRK